MKKLKRDFKHSGKETGHLLASHNIASSDA